MVSPGEGMPIPIEAIFCICEFLAISGYFYEPIVIILALDCVLREQDWGNLLPDDCHFDGDSFSLSFGVRERGEEVKTGVARGVIVDRSFLVSLMPLVLSSAEEGCYLFPFTASHLRTIWNWALKVLQLIFLGPLHNPRHSQPSDDVEKKNRLLEEIRRRGRWAVPSSVQRYSKAYLLVKQRSRLPTAILERGSFLMDSPSVLLKAITKSKSKCRCCQRRRKAGPG